MGGAQPEGCGSHEVAPIGDEPRRSDAAAGGKAHGRLFSVPMGSPSEWQLEAHRASGSSSCPSGGGGGVGGGRGASPSSEPEPREQVACIFRGGRGLQPAHRSRAAGASIQVGRKDVPEQPSPALAPGRGFFALQLELEPELITGSRRRRGSARIGQRARDDLFAQARVAREDAQIAKQMKIRRRHRGDEPDHQVVGLTARFARSLALLGTVVLRGLRPASWTLSTSARGREHACRPSKRA